MDRDALYFHFANLGLVLIGIFSIQSILNPFVVMLLIPGTIAGFLVSWQIRNSRPQHMDTFTGMLSLAAVVVIFGRLFDVAITFDNLLKIFSTALAWLMLFQSFGLKTGKSYAMLQFISICLLISSVSLALEQEPTYIMIFAIFLFIFIFAMRLSLVCERKRKGSIVIGDREEVMSLWRQIKVGALMFSFILILASLFYPFVPRFENLSLRWVPSTLLGIPEQVPLLKLMLEAPKAIEDNKRKKKQQIVDDRRKKRERLDEGKFRKKEEKEKIKKEIEKRFRAKEFDKNIDVFKIESLTIRSDKKKLPLDDQCKLEAELKMSDGSIIPATRLVDWKATGTAEVSIDDKGNLAPEGQGDVSVSASYLGTFSNDVPIEITAPVEPIKKRSWLYYLFIILLWLLILILLALALLIFMRSRRLQELAVKNPRGFIKEVYFALCRGFRVYGISRFDYVASREFFESVKGIVASGPGSMHNMTEGFLEARFSMHNISKEHSHKSLGLFHDVKAVVLERDEGKHFWKKPLFHLLLLDVSLVPRQRF